MAAITVGKIEKSFGVTTVLRDISLDIADGEFLTLLGPSGCGKSTLLRILAGLEVQTAGSVAIGDKIVDGVRPKRRDVAMVFQSYALYPHMTVQENMSVPLRMRRLTGWQRLPLIGRFLPGTTTAVAEIEVMRTAKALGIGHLLARKPGQLSGGQRQRVAVGRAMVRQPAVFLMDEPLSNLDAKEQTQLTQGSEMTTLKKYAQHFRHLCLSLAILFSTATYAAAEQVTLQVDAAASIYSDMFNELTRAFETQNPDIRISLDTSSRDQSEEFQKTLRRAIVNDLPDVSFQGPNYLKVLADNKYIEPIDRWISSDLVWTVNTYSASVTRSARIDGRTMGLGVGFSFPIIYYNADLVKEAQNGNATLPGDWDGILNVAKRIKEIQPNILPIYARTTSLYSQGLIRSLGGRLGDERGEVVTLSDPKTLAAISVFQRIGTLGQGESAMTGDQARQAFSAGQTAIHLDSSSSLSRFIKDARDHFELATSKLPLLAGAELSTSGFIVVMHTKVAARQEAAWRFMKFAASAEGQKIIATMTGFVPGNELAATAPEILGNYYAQTPQAEAVLESIQFAAPWYLFKGSNNERIGKIFDDAMESVVAQKATAEDAVRQLTEQITPLIGD